jgi:uncharacterized protein (TIGR03086 family)
MDVAELHAECVAVFVERVRLVRDGQWTLPTPCTEWTVRELVNHMVAEELWTPPMMAGERIEDVGDRFTGDILGADPVATTERAAPAAVAAAIEPVRAGRTVHLSFGDTPAGEYAMQLAADHLIHAWDLSAAIGADRALPSELVEKIAGWFAEREAWYRQARIIDERPVADDRGDRQRGLLIAFGRDPDWAATWVSTPRPMDKPVDMIP